MPPEYAQRAEIVAHADGVSVEEVFRRAPLEHVKLKRTDADFLERATAILARDAEIVGRPR